LVSCATNDSYYTKAEYSNKKRLPLIYPLEITSYKKGNSKWVISDFKDENSEYLSAVKSFTIDSMAFDSAGVYLIVNKSPILVNQNFVTGVAQDTMYRYGYFYINMKSHLVEEYESRNDFVLKLGERPYNQILLIGNEEIERKYLFFCQKRQAIWP